MPFRFLYNRHGNLIVAPYYHAVSDQPLPHIRHLYRAKNIREFESDLDFLLKFYQPIDFHDYVRMLENPAKVKGKTPFLLSFDDGLREFYDTIAPILMRKGIPAICFLNSSFIDNKALFFRYKASLLIEKHGSNIDETTRQEILAVRYADKEQLDAMALELGLDFGAFLETEKPYLSSGQIEELIKKGFHFGAHSIDHPEYRFLSLQEQLVQTTKSVELVSNQFGLGYRLFSFPFTDYGVSKAFFDFVLQDKKVADLSFGCAGLKRDIHPRHIQRIAMEQNKLSAEEILRKEIFYFWLKIPFGKNRIHRQ